MDKAHCQICEGSFTANKKYMSKPIMSNHGFTRPGDGWLHGSCFGARQNPYEISCDAIPPYIETVKQYRQGKLDYIKRLIENPPSEISVFLGYRDQMTKKYEKPKDFDPTNVSSYGNRYHDYAGAWSAEKSDAEWQVRKSTREIERMEKRLAEWQPVSV